MTDGKNSMKKIIQGEESIMCTKNDTTSTDEKLDISEPIIQNESTTVVKSRTDTLSVPSSETLVQLDDNDKEIAILPPSQNNTLHTIATTFSTNTTTKFDSSTSIGSTFQKIRNLKSNEAVIAKKRAFISSSADRIHEHSLSSFSEDRDDDYDDDNNIQQQQQHVHYNKKSKIDNKITSMTQKQSQPLPDDANLLDNNLSSPSSINLRQHRLLSSAQQKNKHHSTSTTRDNNANNTGSTNRTSRSASMSQREIKTLTSPRRLQSDGTLASCSESQSSACSSVSTPTHPTQPIQLQNDQPKKQQQQQQLSSSGQVKPSLATSSMDCHPDDVTESATVASSEEDSVAEMDYMSENSNISVAEKDLVVDAALTTPIAISAFVPTRVNDRSSVGESSSNLNTPVAVSQTRPNVQSVSSMSALRKVRVKTKEKKGRNKLPPEAISNTNQINMLRPVALEQKSSFKSPEFVAETGGASYQPTSTDMSRINTESSNRDAHDDVTAKNEARSYPIQVEGDDRALYLPKFPDPKTCMWTASHAANCPSEDRSASLVNLLLQPLPPNFDSETQLLPLEPDYKTLIRLNLWAVIDGHGGGCVATYGSEVLLPHIAASVSRALGCAIVDRGVCTVNGQLRDANALDLDGLIQTHSDRAMTNPNSIHYRSPYERSDSDADEECDNTNYDDEVATTVPQTLRERKRLKALINASEESPLHRAALQPRNDESHQASTPGTADASVSSVKTSVKTATSAPVGEEALAGTHSPREVAAITRAITESFLAVDEAWINSIDPIATHQTSCQSNGRWNSGACALVVFTVQRLVWTSVSEPDREKESMEPEKSRRNTTQNRDAARRRMLDYASRTKSASSMSTVSSTSSLTTEEAAHVSGIESEITETEGEDDDRSFNYDVRKRDPINLTRAKAELEKASSLNKQLGSNSGHCYRAHTAMIYTAHVGDCRAVMLGSAPPRTIKVGDFSSLHQDTTDDESSHHSSDETECLSSSDHDADSSEEEEVPAGENTKSATAASSFMNFPRRVARQRSAHRRAKDDSTGPFIALPPLAQEEATSVEFDFETDVSRRRNDVGRRTLRVELSDSSSTSSQDSIDLLPLVHLPPGTRPIDLTTDHSAYNPAEVTAVLRRCNNAPRAISAGVGGGIKRVAGSLAVTRALGDAYLKTPLLSFLPYKSHAPYITARPEVNCRPLLKDGDKVLLLATDGVWERASGEDVLRWVRNFYEERLAEATRRATRRPNNQLDKPQPAIEVDANNDSIRNNAVKNFFQEGSERDLFDHRVESLDPTTVSTNSRKCDSASPVQNNNSSTKRRRRGRYTNANNVRVSYNVADVIVRRVLNKVRQARNISSLQALMSLPQGRARRSKHDDITASVVDLSAFVS